jgi:hypothetical protein
MAILQPLFISGKRRVTGYLKEGFSKSIALVHIHMAKKFLAFMRAIF